MENILDRVKTGYNTLINHYIIQMIIEFIYNIFVIIPGVDKTTNDIIVYASYVVMFSILLFALSIYIVYASIRKASYNYNEKSGNTLELRGVYKSRYDIIIDEFISFGIIGTLLLISLYMSSKNILRNNLIKIGIIVTGILYSVSIQWIIVSIILLGLIFKTPYMDDNMSIAALAPLTGIYSMYIFNHSLPFLDLPRSIM
jgi:hypothetical protein